MSKISQKMTAIVAAATLCMTAFAACTTAPVSSTAGTTDTARPIVVLSREDGSGTRGAFTELFKLEEKQGDTKVDVTTVTAQITNSTGVMMTTVSGNENAIGYISLGSLDDSVRALKIDGAEATTENIKGGTYKISRPFNAAIKGEASPVAADFMGFIASAEGQAVITKEKYIGANDGAVAFKSANTEGKIVIAGSSSVSPLMESLKEAYLAINTRASIEIQTSDSTTGMNSVADGICDIGMASRELKESELAKGIVPTVIAQDGIAVVVNKNNTLTEITGETVTGIYKGEITTWDKVA